VLRTLGDRLLENVRRIIREDGALAALCFGLIVFGVTVRSIRLRLPKTFSFDEDHFVENARNYLAGKADWNDHPPLGKLLIAQGIRIAGDNGVGWRLLPWLFGLALIAIAWLLAARLFRDARAGWLAAAFVACDGFTIAYSRTALLDGMLTATMLGAWCVVQIDSPALAVLGASVLVACAAAIKFTGVVVCVPIALEILSDKRKLAWAAPAVIGGALVYFGIFALGLHASGLASSPAAVWAKTTSLAAHHRALNDMTNPATSYWYTWFLPLKPILLRFTRHAHKLQVMTTLGNPLLWWSCSLVVPISFVTAYSEFWKSHAKPSPAARTVLLLVAAWAAAIAPWVAQVRDSYIWHYLPSYTFGLVLLAGLAARAYRQRPGAVLAFVVAVAVVSLFYAPVWCQLPLSAKAFKARLFLPTWR
jgi:dolichyl-phosphate-mannose--protein O-mannosyl transferase